MSGVRIRVEGRAGRITLARPEVLNALSHAMVRAIAAALEAWRDDPAVALVLVDAEGARAFSRRRRHRRDLRRRPPRRLRARARRSGRTNTA